MEKFLPVGSQHRLSMVYCGCDIGFRDFKSTFWRSAIGLTTIFLLRRSHCCSLRHVAVHTLSANLIVCDAPSAAKPQPKWKNRITAEAQSSQRSRGFLIRTSLLRALYVSALNEGRLNDIRSPKKILNAVGESSEIRPKTISPIAAASTVFPRVLFSPS